MITAEQKLARKNYIGSSDAAAVLGVDPYRSAYDVWLDKTGRVHDWKGNDATDAGTLLESAVLDWACIQLAPIVVKRDVMRIMDNLAANFDGLADTFAVEAKTTGIVGPRNEAYGEITEGPEVELPDNVIVQAHHQMVVATLDAVYVPVLIGGVGFRMYTVERNQELCEIVREKGEQFIAEYVKKDTPPSDSKASIDVLKRMKRVPEKIALVGTDIVAEYKAAHEQFREAKKQAEAADAALLEAMKDAEAVVTDAGDVLTYFATKVKGYEVEPYEYRSFRVAGKKQAAEILEAFKQEKAL